MDSPPSAILVVFPFMSSAFLKLTTSSLASRTREAVANKLVFADRPDDQNPILTSDQLKVLLASLDFSTTLITAGSTLLTTVIAFLVVVLRSPSFWLWWAWVAFLGIAFGVWFWIYRSKLPNQTILRLSVGKFILLLSYVFDAVLAGLSLVVTRP